MLFQAKKSVLETTFENLGGTYLLKNFFRVPPPELKSSIKLNDLGDYFAEEFYTFFFKNYSTFVKKTNKQTKKASICRLWPVWQAAHH